MFYRFLSIKYLYTSKIKRSISNSILTMFIIKSIIHTTSDFYEGFKQTSLCKKNNCTPSKKQPPAIILMTSDIITKILLKNTIFITYHASYINHTFLYIIKHYTDQIMKKFLRKMNNRLLILEKQIS